MAQVRIDMNETLVWWPTTDFKSAEELAAHLAGLKGQPDLIDFVTKKNTPSLEIPDALLSRFNKLREEWYDLQGVFEQMYRQQEGLCPHAEPQIPDYRITKV